MRPAVQLLFLGYAACCHLTARLWQWED